MLIFSSHCSLGSALFCCKLSVLLHFLISSGLCKIREEDLTAVLYNNFRCLIDVFHQRGGKVYNAGARKRFGVRMSQRQYPNCQQEAASFSTDYWRKP